MVYNIMKNHARHMENALHTRGGRTHFQCDVHDFSQCCDCMLRVVASIFRLMRVIFYNVTHAGWLHAKGGRTHFPCDVRDFS